MIAGILNRFGKIGVIVGFILGNTALTYIANGNLSQIIYFREILVASLGLILVPRTIEINISDLIGKTKLLPYTKEHMLEENEDTIYKLNSVSSTIQDISDSYHDVAATMVEEHSKEAMLANKEAFLDEFMEGVLEHRFQ